MREDKFLTTEITNSLSSFLQRQVNLQSAEQVYGGDINTCYHLATNAGNFFLKTNKFSPHDHLFEKEFHGLQALQNANALQVPQPLLYGKSNSTNFIITTFINKGIPAADFWQRFAGGLVRLHQCTADYFGFNENNFIGSLPQSNKQYSRWNDFYIQERLAPLMRMAYDKKLIAAKNIAQAESLYKELAQLLPDQKPSLLHGDLWGGNFMVAGSGYACIYDPAVYYGHREIDLAMARMFGGFDTLFFRYYDEYFPLQKGWQQRLQVYQLYYWLVHLILFGATYYSRVKAVLDEFS